MPVSTALASVALSETCRVRLTLREECSTDHVLDSELVIEGRRETHEFTADWPDARIASERRLELTLGTRVVLTDDGAVHMSLPLGEPALRRARYSTTVQRVRRNVMLCGDTQFVWRVLSLIDGERSMADVLAALPALDRQDGARLLAALAAAGAVDISGRQVGRFLHAATKKGVTPGGGLDVREVLELVTDGGYRTYPDTPAVALATDVPPPLEPLHAVLRRRRSFRDFNGRPIQRAEFDALLTTACGPTGEVAWAGHTVKLRAYPSSGGLYAVEIYPVAFAVEGLPAGVHHYTAPHPALELLAPGTRAPFVDAALPSERAMLSGVAAMICLTGRFRRHETKYGEGGYRMLIAEAGHISQNLLLAATALGLDARPFGGVFDAMVNQALGLTGGDEQFLLSVLIGHAG